MNEKKRLRVAIATTSRFHVLDLARELCKLGHDVMFHSYLPLKRVEQFGFPSRSHSSMFLLSAPLALAERNWPNFATTFRQQILWSLLNRAVIRRMASCDVFVFMSGIYLEAAEYARQKFGAKLIIERGSHHILAQDELLAMAGAERPTPYAIERELAGYAIADCIMVPSRHVALSFERDPATHAKVIINPYGVELEHFPRQPPRIPRVPITFCMVGLWCRRKGCDLLTEAIATLADVKLLHVGSLGDIPFQKGEKFQHLEKVDQLKLKEMYRQCDALVLPSREEGLSLVLLQALASGLPIVCSDHTGAPDLMMWPSLGSRIVLCAAGNLESLKHALALTRDKLLSGAGFPELEERDRQALAWRSYGQRYQEILYSLQNNCGARFSGATPPSALSAGQRHARGQHSLFGGS
jgi:glycosyltransferase involved in cell wall biosynthesis